MDCFLLYLITGVIAGTLSGMLGIGGGIIVIPLLAWILKSQGIASDLIMHMAAGTSLAIMIFTTFSSWYGHIKRGVVVWDIYRRLLAGIIVGTILGAVFGHFLHSSILELIFGVFIFLVSLRMLIALKPKVGRTLPGPFGMFSMALVIGGKSGLLGLGGGAITIPFLSYCNVPIRNTIAISASCSFTIAIIGTISYILTGQHAANLPNWSLGYIYLPAFCGVVITGPLCAQFGAYFSHKLPTKILTKILGAVLLLVAIHMLIGLLP
ncbi:MAG: sulfite exporter TauE/SafE family protein [Gammaproteobacteria bacterium]|nr:sulfite exporter TauE/SafE family protein [Gammaproteobacteria bacterium]